METGLRDGPWALSLLERVFEDEVGLDDGQGEIFGGVLCYIAVPVAPIFTFSSDEIDGLWPVGCWVVAGCVGFDWIVDSGGAMNFSLGGNYVIHKWD